MPALEERRNNASNRPMNKMASLQKDKEQIHVRPTEARLRWAQFHRKQRVQDVKESIERLWQTPASVSDVEGAVSEDGVTTDSSSLGRKRRIKISRGRRAMLRVSRRAYESRRIRIQHEGYYASCDKENEDDELEAMFEEHVVRRRRKTRKSHGGQDEAERVRRFEAAYKIMMTHLTAPAPVQITESKRWTRKTNVSVSIDGRQYDDLKWGFRKKQARLVASPTTPMDRRASWLVHLPPRQASSSSLLLQRRFSASPRGIVLGGNALPVVPPPIVSPGKAKFDEIVAKMQNRSFLDSNRMLSPEYRREKRFFLNDTVSGGGVKRLAPSRKSFLIENRGMASPRSLERRNVPRLSQARREPFLEKQPNESQQEFEKRRESFERMSSKRIPTESQREFDERKHYFEQRNAKRLSNEKRERFFQALQAPYMSAAKPRKSKIDKKAKRMKRLSAEKRNRFAQGRNQQTRVDVTKIPKLCRKARVDTTTKKEPGESSTEAERQSLSIGARVGGLLDRFSGSRKALEEEARTSFRKLQSSLFSGNEHAVESPVAAFRSFFSGTKKSSPSSNTSPQAQDTEEETQELSAFGKMAAGIKMTEPEQVQAATAYQKMVAGKGLNEAQDAAFQKFVSGQDLNSDDADHAATAYRQVVSGKDLTGQQEAAYRMLVSGEELSEDQAKHALEGYQKLVFSQSETKTATLSWTKQQVSALGKLAAGVEMTQLEEVRARDAFHKMTCGKDITQEEQDSYQKLGFR